MPASLLTGSSTSDATSGHGPAKRRGTELTTELQAKADRLRAQRTPFVRATVVRAYRLRRLHSPAGLDHGARTARGELRPAIEPPAPSIGDDSGHSLV